MRLKNLIKCAFSKEVKHEYRYVMPPQLKDFKEHMAESEYVVQLDGSLKLNPAYGYLIEDCYGVLSVSVNMYSTFGISPMFLRLLVDVNTKTLSKKKETL